MRNFVGFLTFLFGITILSYAIFCPKITGNPAGWVGALGAFLILVSADYMAEPSCNYADESDGEDGDDEDGDGDDMLGLT